MSDARKRVFFALWPDAGTAEHLAALGHAMASDHGGRAMRETTLHMTLEFVGGATAAEIDMLRAAAAKVQAAAFDVTLDRLGFWPTQGIIWAGCRQVPKPLLRLHEDLLAQMAWAGLRPDPKPLVPHVTLTRRSRCRGVPRLETPLGWQAEEFVLVESHLHQSGARYEIIERWPLDTAEEDDE